MNVPEHSIVRDMNSCEAIVIRPDVAQDLSGNVEQLGAYLVQMAQMLQVMHKRMDEFEAAQKQVTLTHQDVKDVNSMIRTAAADYCLKYDIMDADSGKAVRLAMKKAILKRYGVKDLHDVPAIARQAVEAQIMHWTDIRLVMKRREIIAGGG